LIKLKTRENAIIKFPDYQIPVTQLGEMRTRDFIIFLGYRCKFENKMRIFLNCECVSVTVWKGRGNIWKQTCAASMSLKTAFSISTYHLL